MKTRTVVAVLLGGIVDIFATNVFAIPVVVYVLLRHNVAGSTGGSQDLAHSMASDPSLQAAMWFLGGVASVLGGYTAALLARRSEPLVGALSAYLCIAFGVWGLVHDASGSLLAQHLAGFLFSPLLGAFGGYLRRTQTHRTVRA